MQIKTDFKLERYLLVIPSKPCKLSLKLRLSNHKLSIETGRYSNTPRSQRICKNCNMNLLGDEYHLFFICDNNYVCDLGNRFIPKYYRNKPSMYKFVK